MLKTTFAFLVMAILSGQGQEQSLAARRDPFVQPEVWAKLTRGESYRHMQLVHKLARRGFSREEIVQLLGRRELATYPPPQRHGGGIRWRDLEEKILSPASIARGITYYNLNQVIFDRTERDTRVYPPAILALFRIESNFGTYTFDPTNPHNVVFNVFYTRVARGRGDWQFAARTLADFAAYCKANGLDPFSIRGSYAGAFGIPQFMPFNVVPYGVDGNGDGRIDLFDDHDAIPSTANFLVQHGWHRNRTQALIRYYGARTPYQRIAQQYEREVAKAIAD